MTTTPETGKTYNELAEQGPKSLQSLRYHYQQGKPKRDPHTNRLTPGSGLFLITRKGGDGLLRVDLADFHKWLQGEPVRTPRKLASKKGVSDES